VAPLIQRVSPFGQNTQLALIENIKIHPTPAHGHETYGAATDGGGSFRWPGRSGRIKWIAKVTERNAHHHFPRVLSMKVVVGAFFAACANSSLC
jgi:hypothetical protein